MPVSIATLCHFADYKYGECHILFIIMVNIILLSVVMLNVVMLSAVAPFLTYILAKILKARLGA
jgi:hypothetical protein